MFSRILCFAVWEKALILNKLLRFQPPSLAAWWKRWAAVKEKGEEKQYPWNCCSDHFKNFIPIAMSTEICIERYKTGAILINSGASHINTFFEKNRGVTLKGFLPLSQLFSWGKAWSKGATQWIWETGMFSSQTSALFLTCVWTGCR